MVYAVVTGLTLVSLAAIISRQVEGSEKRKNLFTFLLIFNWPVIYAIERGNILLFVYVLMLGFVFFHDSEDKVISEISCICLALAASIKMYPAVFGILLIFAKKYKQAIRTVIYHWVDGFKVWINNIIKFSEKHSVTDNFSGVTSLKVSFYVLMGKVFGRFGFKGITDKFFAALIIIAIVAAVLFLKQKHLKFIALFLLVDALPGAGGGYTFVFLTIPLIYLINMDKVRKFDYLYVLVILSEFMPHAIPLKFVKGYTSINYGIEGLAVMALFLLLMCDLVYYLATIIIPKIKKSHAPKSVAAVMVAVLAISVFGGLMSTPVRADVTEDFTPVQMVFETTKYTIRRTPDELIPAGFSRGEVKYCNVDLPALVRGIGPGGAYGYVYVLDCDNGSGYQFYTFDVEKETLDEFVSFEIDGIPYTVIKANPQSFAPNMVSYDTNVTLINGKKVVGAVYIGDNLENINTQQLICLIGPNDEVGYYSFTALDGQVVSVQLYGQSLTYPTPCPATIGNHTLARKLQYSAEKVTVICMIALFVPIIFIALAVSYVQYKNLNKKASNK